MREATVFICDICGDMNEDRQKMVGHETFCRLKKERAEKAILDILSRLSREGLTEDEFNRVKTMLDGQQQLSIQTNEDCVTDQ